MSVTFFCQLKSYQNHLSFDGILCSLTIKAFRAAQHVLGRGVTFPGTYDSIINAKATGNQ